MEDTVPEVELETEVQINIHSSSHMNTMLSSLEEQRKKNFLCDITLVVETVQFRAHKALLAASSEYFAMMFADEGSVGQSIYVIEGMVAEVFETLLQFIYTGNVHVSEKCLKQIVVTAQVLKVDNLVKAYADYQQNLLDEANKAEEADDSAKRKRGRPKKQTEQPTPQAETKSALPTDGDAPESIEDPSYSNGSVLHVADFAAEVTCDLNPKPPEEQLELKRQSKRRPQRSVKLQDYKVAEDEERGKAKQAAAKKKPTTSEACKDCGKVFKYKHFLTIHRRIHTGERPFRCAQCGQGFSQKHSLRVHERIHTGERPYSCTVCSKSLATKRSLMEHMRIHADKKAFTCDKCGKIFSQKRQLKSHYRVHIGERPFTCEMCGKSFTAKSSLLTHMRIHRGEKPYSCNICGKAFADSSAKRRHLTLHTGKKPFSCSDCNIQFTRLDNLKAHIKSHNKEKKPKPPPSPTRSRIKEEIKSRLQTQQYQLATPNVQEIKSQVQTQQYQLATPNTQEIKSRVQTQQYQLVTPNAQEIKSRVQTQQYQLATPNAQEIKSRVQTQQYHLVTPNAQEIKSRVQTQQYQVATPNAQEIQLLVTDSVHNLNFMSGQGQGISLVTAEASPAIADQPANLTLITHPSPVLHGLQVASNQQQVQQIRNVDLIEGRVQTVLPEQMHVVTLSKEAFEQLQGRTHEIHLTPANRPMPLTRIQTHPATTILNQSVRVPEHAPQTLTVSPVTQPVPGHPIQAPSFQIQAGTVSFVNTTSGATNSSSA